ncbi:hypothetical protein LPJ70_001997 [Coemansia sp. RSA 2708]|nr:hypothetical protein LPJ70_001997 [Coemansia sp. RSA 2708]
MYSMGIMLALDSADACTMLVSAEVPLSMMLRYLSQLCSLTAGTSSFLLQIIGFRLITQQQQDKAVKESQSY